MLIRVVLLSILTQVNTIQVKVSAKNNSLEALLWEMVSAHENRIQNEATHTHQSRVIQRRNISLPEAKHTVKYSFSIGDTVDSLKSPIVHVYRTKKKKDSHNRTENIRYKMLAKKTNEEFLSYLDKMIETRTQSLHKAEEKITQVKRKLGNKRFSERPITRPDATEAELIKKLVTKENILRIELAEKLNKYLTAATSLVLPFQQAQPTSHDQMMNSAPQSNVNLPVLLHPPVIPFVPFNEGAIGRSRRSRSPRHIFLTKNEMKQINRLIRDDHETKPGEVESHHE